jgi:hypothetical protein
MSLFRRRSSLGSIVVLIAVAYWSLRPSGSLAAGVVTQLEEAQTLKAAEYEDYTNAMNFEDSNQKLGNYYLSKGIEVHQLIDKLEQGQAVNKVTIDKALDTSEADKYDNRPPVPLDDEIGNGY